VVFPIHVLLQEQKPRGVTLSIPFCPVCVSLVKQKSSCLRILPWPGTGTDPMLWNHKGRHAGGTHSYNALIFH
jgi:hypothetical protein